MEMMAKHVQPHHAPKSPLLDPPPKIAPMGTPPPLPTPPPPIAPPGPPPHNRPSRTRSAEHVGSGR